MIGSSDHRDGHVSFRWRDYADHDRVKVMTLDADEFLRRFLLHVVPRRFMRIRHFGLLANRMRRGTLARCRDLLGHLPTEDGRPESVGELLRRLTGVRPADNHWPLVSGDRLPDTCNICSDAWSRSQSQRSP